MVTEFGEPGVENPMIVDLIEFDAEADRVILVMTERRPWGGHPRQLLQIEEKINRYLGYVLEGHMGQHYPKYVGKTVRIRLDCAEEPSGEAVKFVAAAGHAIQQEGLDFVVNAGLRGRPGKTTQEQS